MVQGEPLDVTTSLSYYAYKVQFQNFDIGYASALVMAQFFVMFGMGLSVIQIRKYLERRRRYGLARSSPPAPAPMARGLRSESISILGI
jgi:hypothetical protein